MLGPNDQTIGLALVTWASVAVLVEGDRVTDLGVFLSLLAQWARGETPAAEFRGPSGEPIRPDAVEFDSIFWNLVTTSCPTCGRRLEATNA